MGAFIGLFGVLLLFICMIWFFIRLIKRKPKKEPMLGLLVCFILIALGVILTPAQGDGQGQKTDIPSASAPANVKTESDGPAADSELVKQPAGGENPKKAGDLGDYYVEIKGAKLATDYDGNPAIVITYMWMNNSESTTNAMVAMSERAFQDGIQLDSALIFDSDICDSGPSMKDVRPGYSIDVQKAFTLTSSTSIVEFELSELISLRNDMVYAEFNPAELGRQ